MIQYKNNANQNLSLKDGSSEKIRIYVPVLQDRTSLRSKNGDITTKDCWRLKLTIQKVIDLFLPKGFELRRFHLIYICIDELSLQESKSMQTGGFVKCSVPKSSNQKRHTEDKLCINSRCDSHNKWKTCNRMCHIREHNQRSQITKEVETTSTPRQSKYYRQVSIKMLRIRTWETQEI